MAEAGQAAGECGEPARRRWLAGRRQCRVTVWFSAVELDGLTAAARRAGMARAAFLARAGMAACRGADPGGGEDQRQVLAEFVRASAQLRRVGVNLNQAVARLNATGQAGGDLAGYAAVCERIAGRLDDLSGQISGAAR